jgi:hypothetical protein
VAGSLVKLCAPTSVNPPEAVDKWRLARAGAGKIAASVAKNTVETKEILARGRPSWRPLSLEALAVILTRLIVERQFILLAAA